MIFLSLYCSLNSSYSTNESILAILLIIHPPVSKKLILLCILLEQPIWWDKIFYGHWGNESHAFNNMKLSRRGGKYCPLIKTHRLSWTCLTIIICWHKHFLKYVSYDFNQQTLQIRYIRLLIGISLSMFVRSGLYIMIFSFTNLNRKIGEISMARKNKR